MTRSQSNVSVGTKIWAEKINAAWRQSAAEIVNAGRILLQAKDATLHGDFENMIKTDLDFSPQTARKLMAVAGDQRIIDRAHGRALPDHWTTLYELTKLNDDEFDQALRDGTIRADMERKDVTKKRKETPQGAAGLDSNSGTTPTGTAVARETPQDDREGEDSVVTEPMHPAATSYEADWQPRASAAGAPTDPVSRLANGLAMAMGASRELDPATAAAAYPEDMPLLADDLTKFYYWLSKFDVQFRARCGAGNDAGLALP